MLFNLLDGELQSTPLIISATCIVIIVLLLAFICDTKKNGFSTKCIAFAGISIALSVGLSFIKLFSMPQGGAITCASILPLLIFAYVYGTKKGVLVGVILGLINFAIDPYIVHPAQVILDYIVAFGAMGLVGTFGKINIIHKIPQVEFLVGSIFACILRFISHVLSGVFAFSMYATTDVWVYSIAYNSFVFIDLAISVAVGMLLLSSKQVRIYLTENNTKENKNQDEF